MPIADNFLQKQQEQWERLFAKKAFAVIPSAGGTGWEAVLSVSSICEILEVLRRRADDDVALRLDLEYRPDRRRVELPHNLGREHQPGPHGWRLHLHVLWLG